MKNTNTEHIVVSGSVHTAGKQDQRVCTQILHKLAYICTLCEWRLRSRLAVLLTALALSLYSGDRTMQGNKWDLFPMRKSWCEKALAPETR